MTTIDTTVKGTYRIENDKGELLAQVDNAITDLGMIFLAGHPHPDPNNFANIPNYFQKGMLAVILAQTTSGEIVIESDSKYFSKVVPRTDGLLQINTTVKKRYVFTSAMTVTHLRTSYVRGTGYTSARTSEAALPSPGLSFQVGEAINIAYTLQFVTNCNQVIQNMPFTPNGSSAINIPPNKTNVRNSPVVIFPSSGIVTDGNSNGYWNSGTTGPWRACLDFPSYQSSSSSTYISNTIYPQFNIYFYDDVDIYDTMTSTTSSSLIQPPLTFVPNTVPYPFVYKKQVSSIKYTVSSDQKMWSTSLRFLFEPGEWPITAKGFSMLLGDSIPGTLRDKLQRANAGIFTALQVPYNPYRTNANMVVGIDYKFNWSRA